MGRENVDSPGAGPNQAGASTSGVAQCEAYSRMVNSTHSHQSLHAVRRLRAGGMALAVFVSGFGGAFSAGTQAKRAEEPALALLEAHCVKCHGGKKAKGGLDLTQRATLLQGGESGAAIVSGKPESSLLMQSVRHAKEPFMPHKLPKLPDDAIELLADWIKAGAPYSRALNKAGGSSTTGRAEFSITEADRKHWAFQPVKRPPVPLVRNSNLEIRNSIDSFIFAKLVERRLTPAPSARKEQLIRRVTFDLIGLPPTPREIDAFTADDSPQAYEKLLDRLLASPHYGERWGRHWLDLARFAESDGFEHDAIRPHSWRYRDYVVRSFNADKPYDRFVREQVAGDELWPDDPDAIIATSFNLLGPDMVDSADQVQRRHNTLNDMTDTTALAFLGLTIGCARCHDHKFEPLPQRDYYRLQAFFTPAAFKREVPVPTRDDRAKHEAALLQYNERTRAEQLEIAALEAPSRARLFEAKLKKLSAEAQAAHRTPADQRSAEQSNLALETEAMVEILDKDVVNALDADRRARHRELLAELKKFTRPPPLPLSMALQNGGAPAVAFILNRGEYSQPGEEVTAGFPAVLPARAVPVQPGKARRTVLADWLTSRDNPLTARVMVNRIWQHHFGRGLVQTPSDFGTHGLKPTHPELLDWLAAEFVDQGWSVKRMHKLILMSAAYRQSGNATPETRRLDPENQFYSRWSRLRLEGEVIRDSLLAIAGKLNPAMGGPGVSPPVPADILKGYKGWSVSANPEDHSRRSIYIFARRNLRFPFLEVFDAPDNNLSCPARERSTSAPQSLTLLNADEVLAAAKALAARVANEAVSTDERISLAYRLTLGRRPAEEELALAHQFLVQSPMNELCRALFNLNAFLYVD